MSLGRASSSSFLRTNQYYQHHRLSAAAFVARLRVKNDPALLLVLPLCVLCVFGGGDISICCWTGKEEDAEDEDARDDDFDDDDI